MMFKYHFVPIEQVQGTNSCKYNEGNVTVVCFKCLMKPYRTFNLVLDEFGIESEVTRKIQYQWQHLIFVRWQNVTDTVAYWTEVMFVWRYYRRKPIQKTGWFCSTHIMQ